MKARKQQLEKYIRILTKKATAAMHMSPSMAKQLDTYKKELATLKGEN